MSNVKSTQNVETEVSIDESKEKERAMPFEVEQMAALLGRVHGLLQLPQVNNKKKLKKLKVQLRKAVEAEIGKEPSIGILQGNKHTVMSCITMMNEMPVIGDPCPKTGVRNNPRKLIRKSVEDEWQGTVTRGTAKLVKSGWLGG